MDAKQISNRIPIEFFNKDIYATEVTGIKIDDADVNYAKCSLKIEAKHLNAANQVMGGVLFTIADFAFAVAANTGGNLTVSLNSNISFLSTVKGDMIYAETELVKDGAGTCVFNVHVTDNTGREVAVVTVTGYRKN